MGKNAYNLFEKFKYTATYKQATIFIILALLAITFCVPAQALSLGLTPADITFNNVLAGGYAQVQYTLSTDSVDNVTVKLIQMDNAQANAWIKYDPAPDFAVITRDKPFIGTIKVTVPADVATGTYSTLFKITNLLPIPVNSGDTVSQVVLGIVQNLTVLVTNQRIESCNVFKETIAQDMEVGQELPARLLVDNSGNVNLNGKVLYSISSLDYETKYVSNEQAFTILPTIIDEVNVNLATKTLQPGQYMVSLTVPGCSFDAQEQLTVYEKGQLKKKGTLTGVIGPVRKTSYEPFTSTATFINEGDRPVQASFQGKIILNDKTVKTFTTQPQTVSAGATAQLTYAYTPSQDGRYIIEGFVMYDQYQTTTKSTITTVRTANAQSSIPYGLIFMGILVAAFVVAIMRKKKKKHVR